jgi:hypothetical protein
VTSPFFLLVTCCPPACVHHLLLATTSSSWQAAPSFLTRLRSSWRPCLTIVPPHVAAAVLLHRLPTVVILLSTPPPPTGTLPQIRLLTRGNPMRRCSRVEHCATSRREGFPNNIQHSVHFTSYVSMKHIHALEGSNNRAILMRDQLLRLRLPFSSRRQPHPFGSTRRLSTIRGAPPCHTAAPPPVSRRPDILYTLNLIAKTTTPTVQILTSTATAPINLPPGEAATLRRASTVASHRPWPPPPPPLRRCPSNPF